VVQSNKEKFIMLETQLLIAPLRYFKDHQARGYFVSELRKLYGFDDDEMKQIFKMKVFKKKMKYHRMQPEYFVSLR